MNDFLPEEQLKLHFPNGSYEIGAFVGWYINPSTNAQLIRIRNEAGVHSFPVQVVRLERVREVNK